LLRLWDKELCKEMGRLSKSRKSVVYYVNKYKEIARKERDSTAAAVAR
jgi:hypothetical protein